MNRHFAAIIFIGLLLPSCGTPTPQATPLLINAYVTSAAYPWVGDLYNCVSSSAVINLSALDSADITIRIGQPENLSTPAFQISTEELLVIVHPQTGVSSLTIDQVHSIFLGQVLNWKEVGGADLPIHVWSFSPDEDIQVIFDQIVMKRQPVTSLARLAVSVQNMADAIETNPGSVGVLSRRLMNGQIQSVLSFAKVPVLVITKTQPTGAINELISCLQQENH
jgi:hypothetical protein